MSKKVKLTINGQSVTAAEGATIWEAAKAADIHIPTLCHHPDLRPEGACRVCVVEVKGARSLVASCVSKVAEGMEVNTVSPAVIEARKTVVELLISNHPNECLACARNGNCELQKIASELGIRNIPYAYNRPPMDKDESNPSLVRDPSKCILCGRCIRACSDIQGMSIYSYTYRGLASVVGPAFGQNLFQAECTFCGQCAKYCPTGAITIKSDIERALAALADPDKIVMVQTAPAVRVGLSEALGGQAGDIVTGKMVSALRQLGFAKVFDTNWSADLTIMEEGHELIHRMNNNGVLPMITSCSPGWVNFVELNYPDLLPHLSTSKSPQAMFGAMLKTFYAQKNDINPSKIVSVSIMPCTAKKFEAQRPELSDSGYRDVDIVLTTSELAQMIKTGSINFSQLPESDFDPLMGVGSGAGALFGTTGGVMEAALRTAYEVLTEKPLEPLEFAPIRGLDGVKEAEISIKGKKLKVVVAHTLKHARYICEQLRAGNPEGWNFIEVMACPGGCINGGGQPISLCSDTTRKRQEALYANDRKQAIRKSHENPEIMALYGENGFLGKPYESPRSHHLLHTHYTEQERD